MAVLETLLLALSLALNLLLWRRVQASPPPAASIDSIARGTLIPPVSAKLCGRTGAAIAKVDLGGPSPAVVYWFSPSCVWCQQNAANLEKLYASSRGRYRFLGLTTADASSCHGTGYSPPFPWYGDVPVADALALGLVGTPETVVIGPSGRVLRSWTGAYVGRSAAGVESFFHLRLPGLWPDR